MVHLPFDDEDAPLYSVGQVADMLEVQQAYLRRLDEHDVVQPARSSGGQRRYSRREIDRLQRANALIGQGLTLAAVRRILELEDRVSDLEADRDTRHPADGEVAAAAERAPRPATGSEG